MVRLLVLLSARPFAWLVNHTTGFFSWFGPRPTISTETDLMRKSFSSVRSSARRYFDWSNDDASSTIFASFCLCCIRSSGVSRIETQFSLQLLQKRGPHQALAAIGSPTAQFGETVISLVNSSVLPKPI